MIHEIKKILSKLPIYLHFIHLLLSWKNVKWRFGSWFTTQVVFSSVASEHFAPSPPVPNLSRCHAVGAQGSFSSSFIINARLISKGPHFAFDLAFNGDDANSWPCLVTPGNRPVHCWYFRVRVVTQTMPLWVGSVTSSRCSPASTSFKVVVTSKCTKAVFCYAIA